MKASLKTKLILSYSLISLALIGSIFAFSNMILNKQFHQYVQEKQENRNHEYVMAVLMGFEDGVDPDRRYFLALAQRALSEGMILRIIDKDNHEIFNMEQHDGMGCSNMRMTGEHRMLMFNPNIDSEYVEREYLLEQNGRYYGRLLIGHYEPAFLSDADIRYIKMSNRLFSFAAPLFLMIAVLIGYVMASKISGPIVDVVDKINLVSKGEYRERIGYISNTKEISELIKSFNDLSKTLEEQFYLKKRMVRDYAHELRTPLAALQSNLEGIIDGVFPPTIDRLESNRQEILRISRMISQIESIGVTDSLASKLDKVVFDLGDLVSSSFLAYEMDILEKGLEVVLNKGKAIVQADKDKLSQVFANLMSNAIKYTDKGKIILSTFEEEGKSYLIVEDTGIGIEDRELLYVFDPLYRTDKSRSRSTGGMGIGLSIAMSIIKAHDGTIEVESEKGKGSRFKVILPSYNLHKG